MLTIADLKQEHTDLTAHIHTTVLSADQVANIEAFCSELHSSLDVINFDVKRRIIELLDVRGKLAIENDERVVYVKCKLGQQKLSLVQTSPWLNEESRVLGFLLTENANAFSA